MADEPEVKKTKLQGENLNDAKEAVSSDAVVPKQEPDKEPAGETISLTVKTPKEKEVIKVNDDVTVAEFKELVASKFGADVEQLCLIFAGRILNDPETLASQGLKDGLTIHLVIKSAPRSNDSGSNRPPADISQTPFSLGSIGGLAGLESLGMGSANFMDLQNRMQSELLSNPELLRHVLDNPLVQRLSSDTESMRVLLNCNPQMQDLIARNPEINNMLGNPELLRQTTELARNPSMLQELMRTHSRVTEPVPFNPLNSSIVPDNANKSNTNRTQNESILTNPSMMSLLQQMSESPQFVQNMLSAPYTQATIQGLVTNPSVANNLIANNPFLQGNAVLQERMRNATPQFLQQLQNLDTHGFVANPQALNAVMQIQQGMEVLRSTAPNLVNAFGGIPSEVSSENVDSSIVKDEDKRKQPESSSGDGFSGYMRQMLGWFSFQNDESIEVEQRYRPLVDQLVTMGFVNREENLRALVAAVGDVNAAVGRLLDSGDASSI